ncbi:hypothetical protein ACWET9_06600 [Streptomyces sp. NPDC004059]
MPRIKLAFWHAGHQPGEEIDVTGEELAALQRDGRVAEVIESPTPEAEPAAEEKAPEKPSRRR